MVGRFTLFTRRCLTNLSGVPSVGQHWECIRTVKMAAVTGSWHSLHLGMMSKYDIAAFCPKKQKKKKHNFAAQIRHGASAAAACECHAPPTRFCCNLHLILVVAATSVPVFLPLDPQIPFVSTGSTFFALLGRIRPLLQPQSCYHSSTFHSSFPSHLFCSQSICLHVSSVSLLSKYSCQLLH